MRQKKKLTRSQSLFFAILWIALVVILIKSTPKVDGMLIVTIILSGVLVGIPIYQSFKK